MIMLSLVLEVEIMFGPLECHAVILWVIVNMERNQSVSMRSAKSAGACTAVFFPLAFWLFSSTIKHTSNVSIATV